MYRSRPATLARRRGLRRLARRRARGPCLVDAASRLGCGAFPSARANGGTTGSYDPGAGWRRAELGAPPMLRGRSRRGAGRAAAAWCRRRFTSAEVASWTSAPLCPQAERERAAVPPPLGSRLQADVTCTPSIPRVTVEHDFGRFAVRVQHDMQRIAPGESFVERGFTLGREVRRAWS